MKTSTAYQISFANAFADLYLDKENGEVALDHYTELKTDTVKLN